MSATPSQSTTSDWHVYHRVSKTGTYSFLAALPLILMYEILVVAANEHTMAQVRVGAEVWLKQLLALAGSTGLVAFGLMVVIIGGIIFWMERRRNIPLRPRYFIWMVMESAVYGVLVAIMVSGIVGAILTAAPSLWWEAASVSLGSAPVALQETGRLSLSLQLALSIGAGIYEELLFRVILVGGLFWILRRAVNSRTLAYGLAAVIGAVLFSWVHYIGAYGDAFAIGSFLFRFVFGLVLNILFLLRGFGIAAWTHALYDVMLVVGLFG